MGLLVVYMRAFGCKHEYRHLLCDIPMIITVWLACPHEDGSLKSEGKGHRRLQCAQMHSL